MIIYKTTNLLNGKFYIGKDEKNNPNYLGSGIHLKRAIHKYGKDNFIKEEIDSASTRNELNEKEIFWIESLSATTLGYNIAQGGTGGKTIPIPHNKGKTYEELYGLEKANELKEKKKLANLGKKLSEETKEKIKIGNTGKKYSEKTKSKMSKSQTGKIHSEVTKEKISLMVKKHFDDNEKRLQLSEKHKGKILTDEHKLNISKGVINYYNTNENRK